MTRAAAYVRVSTDEQAEHGHSIPAQKRSLLSYAKSQGWEIVEFYVDDGYSGKDLGRPAMTRLLADAEAGRFDLVLVYKLDRLSRRQKDVLYLLEDVFDPAGVGFKSVTETFDTTTPFGKASLGMMAVFAQLEREQMVQRVKAGLAEATRKGLVNGGIPPYGYDYNPEIKGYVVNPVEAEVVRLAFRLYLEGLGTPRIAEYLDAHGYPNRSGKSWANGPLAMMLRGSKRYLGYARWDGQLYEAGHEAIIDEQTHLAVQAELKRRGKDRSWGKGLLSGLAYCECGRALQVHSVRKKRTGKTYRYYLCPDCHVHHRYDDLNRTVYRHIAALANDSTMLKRLVSRKLAQSDREQVKLLRQIDSAQKALGRLDARLGRWYDAFESGALDPDQLTERVAGLREERRRLIDEKERLLAQHRQAASAIGAGQVLAHIADFEHAWGRSDRGGRRRLLKTILCEISVTKDGAVRLELKV
jgi:site-specific DNA recombinase